MGPNNVRVYHTLHRTLAQCTRHKRSLVLSAAKIITIGNLGFAISRMVIL